MSQKKTILNLFNVEKREKSAVILMLAYSFFMGIGVAFFYTSTTSLFLVNFEPEMFPYAYIVGGLAVYFFGLLIAKLQKMVSFKGVLISGAIFLLLSIAILLGLFLISGNKWVAFALFVWIRIVLYLQGVSFWGIAAKIFDLRQGKRLFGLIGSGEVISHIISFFSIPFILKAIETEDLLFISIIGFVCSFLFLIIITNRFKGSLAIKSQKASVGDKKKNEDEKVGKSKYFRLVFALAILPMFAIFFVDFIFFAQTKIEFPVKDVLSSFLALFFGVGAIIEFVFKTFVSGRIISKYGIKIGLLSLPVMLASSVFLASVYGTIFGMAGMFFSFVALSKLFLRSVRTSFYDPSFQILFQPLAPNLRFAFQNKIEGGPKAFGNIIAGGTLLIMTIIHSITLVHYNYVFLVILIIWCKLAYDMYFEYRSTLNKILQESKSNFREKIVSPIFEFVNLWKTEYKKGELIRKINILRTISISKTDDSIKTMILIPSLDLKSDLIAIAQSNKIIFSPQAIFEGIKKEEDISQKLALKQLLETTKRVENFSYSELEALSKSENCNDRMLAAQIISWSSRYNSYKIIQILIFDKNPIVRKMALLYSYRIKRFELWPVIIEKLGSAELNNIAYFVIKKIGPPILDYLDSMFYKSANNKEIQLKIIKLISEIGTKKAVSILLHKIEFPEKEIKLEILLALSKLNYKARGREIQVIDQEIEECAAIAVWFMAAIHDIPEDEKYQQLIQALKEELVYKIEKTFLLLSVIYDRNSILLISQNLESGNKDSRIFAMEIMDLTISEKHKNLIIPLIDDITNEQKLELLNWNFPQSHLSFIERLKDIIHKDFSEVNSWVKGCAIELLEEFNDSESKSILKANMFNSNLFLMELSACTLFRMNSDEYYETMISVALHNNEISSEQIDQIKKSILGSHFNGIQKIRIIKQLELFKAIPEKYLTYLTPLIKQVNLKEREQFIVDDLKNNSMICIVEGIITETKAGIERNLAEKEFFFWLPEMLNHQSDINYQSIKQSKLLIISIDELDDIDLLLDQIDIAGQIVDLIGNY